jgi:hypothetical protein
VTLIEKRKNKMRLTDLNPQWYIGPDFQKYLEFDCPKCMPSGNCILCIPKSPGVADNGAKWDISSDDFATLTVSPSIFHHCKSEAHFFVRDGEIQMC